MGNIQVTRGATLNDARSESVIVIDPRNPQRMVAASKRFRNITTYDFTIATAYSIDGGQTWRPSGELPLLAGWVGITDPAMTWDDAGNVYMVGLAFHSPPSIVFIGIATYKSTDGGATWSFSPGAAAQPIHADDSDDKQWVTADMNPASPYAGRVYAAWDTGAGVVFARTLDHGASWIGTGANPPGSVISAGSFFPEINVAPDGAICVVTRTGGGIGMVRSLDGGDSFVTVTPPASSGVIILPPSLPGGKFRVYTLPTASAGAGQRVIVAWADYREQVSRIYYALSTDGGKSWLTGPSGRPLFPPGTVASTVHHFHPQMIIDSRGTIGCAYYEFGPKPAVPLIDVFIAQSFDGGATFPRRNRINDMSWDPTVDAPRARGNPDIHFIGEYFGLDASDLGFYALWTDTRTAIQELWTDVLYRPFELRAVYAQGDPGAGIDGWDLRSADDRAVAYDYDSSGKLDHLVIYRPGRGAIFILRRSGTSFIPVYRQSDPGSGIGGYDLKSPFDQVFAYDYDSSGKLDHLVLYRPGNGAIFIIKRSGTGFTTVYAQGDPGNGIGGWDLKAREDRMFAFDYDGSGKRDHLVVYRPGKGAIFILKRAGTGFTPVYRQSDPGSGIGGWDLKSTLDQGFAFDQDGTGKLDHLVFYRPGLGAVFILRRSGAGFIPVYRQSDPGAGIGGYDLRNSADRMLAYDFDGSGKPDYLVVYRPDKGTIWILRRGGGFTPVFRSFTGIAGYDLLSVNDGVFAYDYDSSGRLDHLVLYRPGTGAVFIVKKT